MQLGKLILFFLSYSIFETNMKYITNTNDITHINGWTSLHLPTANLIIQYDINPNPNSTFTYIPNTDFVGVDSFTYRANDGYLGLIITQFVKSKKKRLVTKILNRTYNHNDKIGAGMITHCFSFNGTKIYVAT